MAPMFEHREAPEALYGRCMESTRAFAREAGFSQVVLGLSGGIDSALVAAIAAEAFGPENVHSVLMPGPYSSQGSLADAMAQIAALKIGGQMVSITRPYEAFMNSLGPECKGEISDVTSQNIQARCRMVVLMGLSNQFGWMVLNTGNRTEACLGYSTLHGDMVGSFAPIGGLYKTQVYAVCRYLNERAQAQGLPLPIPPVILEKAPSAELAANQTDEASLGASYATIDALLQAHVDDGLDAAALVEAGFAQEDVDNILGRYVGAAWKRAYEPPCA